MTYIGFFLIALFFAMGWILVDEIFQRSVKRDFDDPECFRVFVEMCAEAERRRNEAIRARYDEPFVIEKILEENRGKTD